MSCDRLLRVTHAEAQHIAAGLHALAAYFESDNDHFDALATDNGAVDLIPAPAVYSLAEDLVSGRRTPPLSAWFVSGFEANARGSDTLVTMHVVAADPVAAVASAISGNFQRGGDEIPGTPVRTAEWVAISPPHNGQEAARLVNEARAAQRRGPSS